MEILWISLQEDVYKRQVLISGGGTNLQALLDTVAEGRLLARISGVISSTKHAYGLVRAEHAGIPTRVISKRAYPDLSLIHIFC